VQQARQLAAVRLRQVPLGGAHLFLDQVEVVEQPFAGRRDRAAGGDGGLQHLAGGNQHAFVLGQAPQEEVPGTSRAQSVRSRQRLAMALHLVCAIELRAQRGLRGLLRAAQRRRHDQGFVGSDLSDRKSTRLNSSHRL